MDLLFVIIFTSVIITLTIAKYISYQKIDFVSIILTILLIVGNLLWAKNIVWVKILVPVLLGLIMVFGIYRYIIIQGTTKVKTSKLYDFLKTNEIDYFFQTNSKDVITDFSKNIYAKTTLTKKDLLHHVFWSFIFDYFLIESINNEAFNLEVGYRFLACYKEATSKHKQYQFEMIVEIDDKDVKFIGLVEPLYYGKKLIGRNIYLYQDRMQIVNNLQNELGIAIKEASDVSNQAYILMSLADQVVLYYDYLTKTYVASEAFCRFTDTHPKEYVFSEILDMIHPDDYDNYLEQTKTVNSIVVTKIKFRLAINNEYYQVIEDSIMIRKESGLVSIIRILNKEGDVTIKDAPLSTKEANEIIDKLNNTNIKKTIDDVESTLDTLVGDNNVKEN